ncbi:YfhO family protein [Streptomyces sp. NPDC057579]|uniref:YfhO family protein n=1 Tax=Streptomyces sp. NPDC057579 TaxID=3346172 RepID=UPI003682B190
MSPTPSAPQEGVRTRGVARTSPGATCATPAGRTRWRRSAAPGLAALLSMGAYCLALAAHGGYPFGPRSRAVNDLGNQFVPFHARLWDLLHGTAHGDLFFNWGSGYGVPFLADFVTYLMNPFSVLVGVFPRALVDLPVFLVTLLSIGLGAALMTVLLGRLRPGPGGPRALLAVGYGLCAWVLNDGAADPMWMWGLVSLPLLGIAADWCLRRVRWVTGTLLVALAWAGNFYTAAMATLATGLVLAVRLLVDDGDDAAVAARAGGRRRAAGRAAAMAAVGIALAAPVLTVTLKASRASQPPPPAVYGGRPPLLDQLAQLLPGGHGAVPAPNIFVGVPALLLVAAFPFVRAVPARVRIGWSLLAAGIGASFVWKPTILLWHGLALPNGSPYRAAFVLSGVLVMIAWLALAHRPRPRELAAGAGLVAVLLWCCRDRSAVSGPTWIVVAGGGAVVLAALLAPARLRARPLGRAAVTAVLVCATTLTAAYTAFAVATARDGIPWFQPKLTLTEGALATRRGLAARDDWPRSRTDPGPHEFADNDPLLLGGEGGAYYSSYVPAATARTLHGLGAGWYIRGRHTLSFEDPVGRALMGVSSAQVQPVAGGPRGSYSVWRGPAAPLLTVRRGPLPGPGTGPDTVFARQERLLGARVYEVPRLVPGAGPPPERAPGGWVLPDRRQPTAPPGAVAPQAGGTVFTARCTPGGEALWYAPWFAGEVGGPGTTTQAVGRWDVTAGPLRRLGTVPADGTVPVRFAGEGRQYVPERAVGCLPPGRLAAALRALEGPVRLTAGGHGLTARVRPGAAGTAVLALPAVSGWGCSVDGGPVRAPGTFGGLMTVPLEPGAARLSCAYTPPGLAAGVAVSGAGVLAVGAVAKVGAVRRRRPRPTPPGRPNSAFHQDL